QVVPELTVFHTPPDATAMKYLEWSFGSTAKPFTRPEVTAGPIERKRRPEKVGDESGSAGRSAKPPSPSCWLPPCCPPPPLPPRPCAYAESENAKSATVIKSERVNFTVEVSFMGMAIGSRASDDQHCAKLVQKFPSEKFLVAHCQVGQKL